MTVFLNDNDFVILYQTKSFWEKLECVIVSRCLIFMFVEQLIFVDVFSQLYYPIHAKKTTMADFRYKSIKSWKVDNIDLTQQFSLSIFTDFRYQSIKIPWLLPIFIDWLLRAFSVYEVVRVASRVNKQTTRLASDANNFVNAKSHARGKPGSARRVLDTRGSTWVFFGWVCAARDSKLAPRSKKNSPKTDTPF